MSDLESLPEAWSVWSVEDDGRVVLAYRPDVFDGEEFPAACLPTLYLTHGKRTRRPGTNPTDRTLEQDWFVTFYLEPDVSLNETNRFETRAEGLERTMELARQFDDGEIDYRALYQVPREAYFDRLDDLTGSNATES
ncbi:hypothetical protein C491_09869 [Natronococcus amylolyticus DSM 10524]|uniref:Uncharacterized protein n=1 Tax=Natronococcus amylolyticus DSM 10524 TaxID=1227497 RepID=L9XBW0_9EURY|nr:DUF5820 family protein [Natronococcus amylolyticus]ELY58093.1 hypothetical protein C491_09869 [Natronococcus amylolyticus DSM 10524]